MKYTYENPICAFVALSSADVITLSGGGVEFSWRDGVKNADQSALSMDDGYGN